jgi:ZIP family zinc transporter
MPPWLAAGFWGGVAGSALLLGAAVGFVVALPERLIAGVMAFGAGVLISALAFELMAEAYAKGGFTATALGFVGGASVYTAANVVIARYGAKHRKRSGPQQPKQGDAGLALAVGALLDGIPESIVIGTSLLAGGKVSVVAVAAVFLSNVPEGLSSSAGMKKAGRSALYVFGLWTAIAIVSGLAALLGYVAFAGASPDLVAAVTAVAAGAILAMIADTMIPEATEKTHNLTGLLTVLGFLAAFILSKLDE